MSEIIKKIAESPASETLYPAFELGNTEWKLGFSMGLGLVARQRKVQVGDLIGLELRRAKKRFKLVESAWMLGCYEAGRDGLWLHPYLTGQGVENLY